MSSKLNTILELWRKAAPRARLAVGASLTLLLLVVGLGGYQASRPDFVPLRAGLDDVQRAACEAALAEGALPYEVSPFPGPYTIYVDRRSLYKARNLVALSGALTPPELGIPSGSTRVSSVWQTTVERLQTARKREWQECEKQLQALDFVERATVTGSLATSSPFAPEPAPTISVSLVLKPGVTPGAHLGRAVAKIVRYRFNTPPENVVVVDQHGRMLYDGSELAEGGPRADDLLELERRHDQHKAAIANGGLAQMFGAGVAHVTVDSEWSYDRVESIRESLDPENKVVVSESSTSSKTPTGGGPGGAAGTSTNLATEFGVENAAPGRSAQAPTAMAQESGTQRVTAVGRETRHQLSHAPTMRRMSIALAVDSTLADRLPELEKWVKAALHFDEARGDRFSAFATAFAGIERDERGLPVPATTAPPAEPNVWLELLLERGLEVLAGLVFVVVLLKSLKGARAALSRAAETSGAVAQLPAVDPELLARVRVEELIQSDPERVGEILSRWALEDEPVGASR